MLASQEQENIGVLRWRSGLCLLAVNWMEVPADATKMALCRVLKGSVICWEGHFWCWPSSSVPVLDLEGNKSLNFHLHISGAGLQNGKTKTHHLTRPSWKTLLWEWIIIADKQGESPAHIPFNYNFITFFSRQFQKTPEMLWLRSWVLYCQQLNGHSQSR